MPQASPLRAVVADSEDRPAAQQDARQRIRTFDVFDTLIARRCIEPTRIHAIMSELTGIAHFAQARAHAEARVTGQPYTLDDIYVQLADILALDPARAFALKTLEAKLELENVMPIAEHMAEVRDGDVLISDMYLGDSFIRGMLDKAGLTKRVALVVTADGKRCGRIWPEVVSTFDVEAHTGDHPQSDHLVPMQFGLATRLTTVNHPTVVEKTFCDIGLRDLAMLCREGRLTTTHPDTSLRALQVIQANHNFPILVLASIALARRAQALGMRRILFSSRDCNLWLHVFAAVSEAMGLSFESDYFYTSRLTRTQPSHDYLAYARERLDPQSLVVDICGTGWSLAHLFQTLGLTDRHVFFLQKMPSLEIYETLGATPATCTFHSVLDETAQGCRNDLVEMANYADHGMVTDVRMFRGKAVPVFSTAPKSTSFEAAVTVQRATLLHVVEILRAHGLRETLTLDDPSLTMLSTALVQGLSQQQSLYGVFSIEHALEDSATMKALGCQRPAATATPA